MEQGEILFSAVGDVSLGDHPLCVGFGGYSNLIRRHASYPFEHVSQILRRSDLVFGNLECTLSRKNVRETDYNSIQMRGAPAFADGLAKAGFSIFNLANNHSLQHGKDALNDTVQILEGRDIRVTGLNNGDCKSALPTILDVGEIKIGFLGYSLRPRQYFSYEPLYAEGQHDSIICDIQKLGSEVDLVIVSVHWGDEFIQRPAPNEITLGRAMIDAGAHVILGHHPHVLRGIERYRHGIIAYSLGNFVCDMTWDDSLRLTGILQCRLSKGCVHEIDFIPCYINDSFQPVPQTLDDRELAINNMAQMSSAIQKLDSSSLSALESIYLAEADLAQRWMRRRSHNFFLRKSLRVNPAILIQQVGRYVSNRIHELRHMAKKSQSGSG